MNLPLTPELKGKLEELLGERRPAGKTGKPPASAVRWRDVEELRRGLIDAGGAGAGTGGTPGTDPTDPNPDPFPDDIQDTLDRHQREIDAAELDAQNALIAAQNAQAGLNTVWQDALDAVNDARSDFAIDFQTVIDNANRADTAKLVALQAATNALPARIAPDGAFFTSAVSGPPDSPDPGFPAGYQGVFGAHGVAFPTSVTANQLLRTKGVLPYVSGHTYRITARVISIGGVTANRLLGQVNVLGSDHVSVQQVNIGNLVPAVADGWNELTLEWKAPATTGRAWVRLGAVLVAATLPAREIRVEWIRVEDVSAEKAAAGYAIDAGAYADSASGSAAATLIQKGLAESAAGLAEDYRDQALLAVGDAQDAVVAARDYMQISARYLGGSTLIYDTLLDPLNGWTRTPTQQGTFTLRDNLFAPIGKTWDFTVTNAQDDGMTLSSASDLHWPGQTDAGGYVVEIDYTMLSGGVTGAGVSMIWRNTLGADFRATVALPDMQSGIGSTGRKRIARAVFVKPASFTGTFNINALQFWANNATLWPTRSAKRIQVHRIIIRAATEEEMGRGVVLSNIMAQISQDYITKADANGAVAGLDERVTSEFGTTNAQVSRLANAISNLNGSVATAALLAETDDGTAIAGFQLAAWNTDGQGTGAAVKIHGNVLAPGTINGGAFVAGFGSNKLQNSRFYDRLTHWIGVTGAQTTIALREKGQTWAHPSFRTLMLEQIGTAAELATIRYSPQTDADNILKRSPGASCEPSKIYGASGYLSLHRCRGRVGLVFFNDTGAQIGNPVWSAWQAAAPGSSTNPDTWPRVWVNGTAPVNAAYVAIWVQKEGTLAGNANSYLFLWKPQLEETHRLTTLPSLYTSGTAGYWTGDMFFSRSIKSREIDTEDLAVTGLAKLNKAYVGHLNLNGFAVAKIIKKVFHTRWNGEDIWKLTINPGPNDWTSGWVDLGTIAINRVAGYQTEFVVYLDHAGAGSWDSGKPNMAVAQVKFQRKIGTGAYVDLPGSMFHLQSGEWGVRVTNSFSYTDTNTAGNVPGVSTLYRAVARKANITRHQNMTPYIDNIRWTLTHYKQGA